MTRVHLVILVPLEVPVISTIYDFQVMLDLGVKDNKKKIPTRLVNRNIRVAFVDGYASGIGRDQAVFDAFKKCLPDGYVFHSKKIGKYTEDKDSLFSVTEVLQRIHGYRQPSTYYEGDFMLVTLDSSSGFVINKHILLTQQDVRLLARSIWLTLEENGITFTPEEDVELIPPFFKSV